MVLIIFQTKSTLTTNFQTILQYLTAWMVEKDESEFSQQYTEQDNSLQQFKKQIYSYSDVSKITNNFGTIVGKGGFEISPHTLAENKLG